MCLPEYAPISKFPQPSVPRCADKNVTFSNDSSETFSGGPEDLLARGRCSAQLLHTRTKAAEGSKREDESTQPLEKICIPKSGTLRQPEEKLQVLQVPHALLRAFARRGYDSRSRDADNSFSVQSGEACGQNGSFSRRCGSIP